MLLENGIQPDVLVLRTEKELTQDLRKKVGLFCNVDLDSVIQSIDVSTIYEVPVKMLEEKLDITVMRKLGLKDHHGEPDMKAWYEFLDHVKNPAKSVDVALVGKYVELKDSYKSILESFVHAGAVNNCKVNVHCIHSELIDEKSLVELLGKMQGILVAPGFGDRGIDGKILAAKYARENNIPFFGVCLGMQCAVIEFARNVLGLTDSHSTEMSRTTTNPVIDLMESQKGVTEKGGTMRLGSYACHLKKNTKAQKAYGLVDIYERHRHRYEFNNEYLKAFEKAGMIASGINPDSNLVEIMEIPSHKWFIGVQFHPEYQSTVLNPHPLFVDFIKAVVNH
jgi:CTP synthase